MQLSHTLTILIALLISPVTFASGPDVAIATVPIPANSGSTWADTFKNSKLLVGAGATAALTGATVIAHKKWPWFNRNISTPVKEKIFAHPILFAGMAAGNIFFGSFICWSYRSLKEWETLFLRNHPGEAAAYAEYKKSSWTRHISAENIALAGGIGALATGGALIAHKCWPWFNKKI